MDQPQLAIDGGDAVFPDGPPGWPIADDEILHSIQTALADGSWGRYESHWTEQLIEKLSQLSACEKVMLLSSGTVAVEVALRAVDVQPGSEVILAAYDFPGNFRAIEAIGARPVIVDVVENGWVLDADQVAEAIGPETRAIIASHLHGQVADCPRLLEICRANGLGFVEDVCQMPGGKLHDKALGSFGDVSVFSFGGSKLLSAGRGGAIATNNSDYFQRAKIFCNRGNEAFPFSQLQAAALIPQVGKLQQRNEFRLERVRQILTTSEELQPLSGLKQIVDGDLFPVFYKLPWLLEIGASNWTRDEFVATFQAEGLAIDVGFRGFTRRSVKRCRPHGTLINSRIASQQTVILHHPILLESETLVELVGLALIKVCSSR